MAPAKIRGAVNQLFQVTTCTGILVANLINYGTNKIHPWGWRLSLGLATIPATLMFFGGLYLPETPNSLVEQGRLEEGRQVLERVRGTKKVDAEFADLIDASNLARAVKHPFKNLLKRKNRPQLIVGALAIPAFQQLTGMNSILFYAPVIFQSLGFGSGAALYSSIFTSGALLLGAFISMSFVDKFGRRKFFLEAGIEMICCMVRKATFEAFSFLLNFNFFLLSSHGTYFDFIDFADCFGHNFGFEVWRRRNTFQRNWHLPCYCDLHLCFVLWKVLGTFSVACGERDLPLGNKICWTERGGLRQSFIHSFNSSMFLSITLSS